MCFAGARRTDIIQGGKIVPLHAKCLEVLERARSLKWGVHALSVNWSAEYIRASLGQNAVSTERCFA